MISLVSDLACQELECALKGCATRSTENHTLGIAVLGHAIWFSILVGEQLVSTGG